MRLSLLVAVSLLGGMLLSRLLAPAPNALVETYSAVASSALWSAVTDDDLPVVVVVGDYFIFGELNAFGNVGRMVREFEINSSRDLDELAMLDPERAGRYLDLDLTYVPSSVPSALQDLVQILLAAGKPTRVVSMSDLATADMRDSHIVYVGYLSALGRLTDFVFGGSTLEIGETYDEILDSATGTLYVSEAGMPVSQQSYRDYGLFSSVPGPGGNQFVFVTGTRDEGLMQTAQAITAPALVPTSVSAIVGKDGDIPTAFEILYQVAGLDRTNLDATIVHAATLDESDIADSSIPGD